ncbi:uncharacterized protein LOC144162266 isoform X1 [Haemaphysalis longicornis]
MATYAETPSRVDSVRTRVHPDVAGDADQQRSRGSRAFTHCEQACVRSSSFIVERTRLSLSQSFCPCLFRVQALLVLARLPQQTHARCFHATASRKSTAPTQATIEALLGAAVFVCPECGECLSSQDYLDKHMEDSHSPRPPGKWRCAYCSYTTDKRNNMMRHQQTHTGDRPFSCPSCDKKFPRQFHLVRHQRVHTGERPYKCPECGQLFSHSFHLAKHRELHLGAGKPHACHVCGQAFRLKSDLTRHFLVHTGEKRHPCRVCGERFARASLAKRHERLKHGGKVASSDSATEK